MILHTKFSVGDQVYVASCVWGTKRVTCEDCDGKGDFAIEGKPFRLLCSVCCGPWDEKRGWREIGEFQAQVRLLTVGQVRVQRGGGEDKTEYMCVETGVGSGTVWREEQLLSDHAEAHTKAGELVAEQRERARKDEEEQRQRNLRKRARKKAAA